MAEDSGHLGLDLLIRPVWVLGAHPGGFHFAGRPVQLFGQLQAALARHGAQNLQLTRTGLVIRHHAQSMACLRAPGKPETAPSPEVSQEFIRLRRNVAKTLSSISG